MAIPATVGAPVPVVLILEDGNESRYPQAEVYEPGGTVPVATIDLPHKVKGRYEGAFTPPAAEIYTLHFFIYADAGHSIEDITYTRSVDQVVATDSGIDDLASNLLRVLGLVHQNVFIDNTIHDAYGSLVAARVRIFDSQANVEAATDGGSETTGLIATYEIDASFEGSCRLGTYRMKIV